MLIGVLLMYSASAVCGKCEVGAPRVDLAVVALHGEVLCTSVEYGFTIENVGDVSSKAFAIGLYFDVAFPSYYGGVDVSFNVPGGLDAGKLLNITHTKDFGPGTYVLASWVKVDTLYTSGDCETSNNQTYIFVEPHDCRNSLSDASDGTGDVTLPDKVDSRGSSGYEVVESSRAEDVSDATVGMPSEAPRVTKPLHEGGCSFRGTWRNQNRSSAAMAVVLVFWTLLYGSTLYVGHVISHAASLAPLTEVSEKVCANHREGKERVGAGSDFKT